MAIHRIGRRSSIVAAAATMTFGLLVGAVGTTSAQAASGLVSSSGIPTYQTNDTVWALGSAQGKTWVGGSFTQVRPPGAAPGTKQVTRTRLAVFSSPSVLLSGDYVHSVNGTVRSITASPDGQTVYVGGQFSSVDGKARAGVAAFDASTGLLTSWVSAAKVQAFAISVLGDRVYLGGSRLAAVSATTGATISWPVSLSSAFGQPIVYALAALPDGSAVIVGGAFSSVNGAANTWTAARVSPSGAVLSFPAHNILPVLTSKCRTAVKTINIDSGVAYLGDEGTGTRCFDGTWAVNTSSFSLKWRNRCLGATQAVLVFRGYLYKGSHAHDCSLNVNDPNAFPQGPARHLLAEQLANGYLAAPFGLPGQKPDLGVPSAGKLGPRAMATDGTRLWIGGDFSTLNGHGQQGLVAFS